MRIFAPGLLLALAGQSGPDSLVPLEVSVRRDADGRRLCTVRADQVGVDRVVEELARRLSELPPGDRVVVEGFTPPLRAALVTVDLEERPVSSALRWVLGSVGLGFSQRPGAITVFEDSSEQLARDELVDQAMLAYVRATRAFPDHELGAAARMQQGLLEQERGNLSASLSHFEAVQEVYRDSPLVPEALWRRGLVLERMGHWSEANLAFRTLANSPGPHERQAEARLEMARCAAALGDPLRAIHVLEALELSHPAQNRQQEVERLLVRGRALVDSGKGMEALRALAPALGGNPTELQRRGLLVLEARAFELIDMPSEAAWAWQTYSREVEGVERSTALENAARLSLQAGEDLNVLFLQRLAEREGTGERLEPFVAEAQMRLGLGEPPPPAGESPRDTLARAERLLEDGRTDAAARLLEPLFRDRRNLGEEEAASLYPLWASCLEARAGLDPALRMLRTARAGLSRLEHRRGLDLAAARLLESHELFDRAVAAYEGRY